MVLIFGGFAAAGVPLAGAVASIAGGLVALLAFTYVIDLDITVVNVVTVLGLGLCIDYSLLMVSRYREQMHDLVDLLRPARTARSRAGPPAGHGGHDGHRRAHRDLHRPHRGDRGARG